MTSLTNFQSNSRKFYNHHFQVIHIALIMLVGSAIYSNTLNVPFILDDTSLIGYYKLNITDILLHGGARRVADATFAINSKIHGLQVAGYHLVNLAIHLSSAAVLYFVISSFLISLPITSVPNDETAFVERFMPLAVALLFVSHPIQTQAVTYIIQRYTSLATLFYLISILSFLKCRLAVEKNVAHGWVLFLGGVSLVAGLLAMGSKQIAVTLPFMLLFIEILFFQGRLINKRFYLACGTLLLIVLFAGVVKWHNSSWHDVLYDLNHATSEDHTASRSTYFLTQTCVVSTYLRLLCLPIGQSLMHDYPTYRTLFSVPVIASLALHIFLVSTAFALSSKSRKDICLHNRLQGVLKRLASLGIIWFYVTMTVESTVFPIRDVIFEHRIYLPSIGFFMTIIAFTALITLRRHVTAWYILAAVSLVLGGMTVARNDVWNNSLTFWQDTVRKAPHSGLAIANLGGEYLALNMPDKALPLFLQAMRMSANFQAFHLGEALNQLNIDKSRFTTGREFIFPEGAIVSDRMDRMNVMKYEVATQNTSALAYEYLGDLDNAKHCYLMALSMDPAYDKAWYNLGLLSVRMGDKQQAANALFQLKRINSVLAEDLASSLAY